MRPRVAHEQEARVGVTDKRDRRARDDHAWSVVAAHGVERYGDWSTHMVPLPKGKTLLIPAQAAGMSPLKWPRIDPNRTE